MTDKTKVVRLMRETREVEIWDLEVPQRATKAQVKDYFETEDLMDAPMSNNFTELQSIHVEPTGSVYTSDVVVELDEDGDFDWGPYPDDAIIKNVTASMVGWLDKRPPSNATHARGDSGPVSWCSNNCQDACARVVDELLPQLLAATQTHDDTVVAPDVAIEITNVIYFCPGSPAYVCCDLSMRLRDASYSVTNTFLEIPRGNK